jgi:hypothetical protein
MPRRRRWGRYSCDLPTTTTTSIFYQDEQPNRHEHHRHPHNTSSPTTSSSSSRIRPAIALSAILNSTLTTFSAHSFLFKPTIRLKCVSDCAHSDDTSKTEADSSFYAVSLREWTSKTLRLCACTRDPHSSGDIDCMCEYTINNGFSVA